MKWRFCPLGDQALLIELGDQISSETQQHIQMFSHFLEGQRLPWLKECIPAYTNIAVFYDIWKVSQLCGKDQLPYEFVCAELHELLKSVDIQTHLSSRKIDIPVCYGGEFGPDLDEVARLNHLTPDEVITIHAAGDYLVHMIGFAPGFPFIGGMSEKIAAPRRKSPRLQIPARTVGIAGMQTGVYPIETPGGWQLIGRTPIELFTPEGEMPTLLRAGDRIQFKPISFEEYKQLEAEQS
ncbi:5-oxoprolinase subunit PxpB [Cytobacillus sp. Sa5YUA1]|uniref:5-oxoprolinase subunit PxpB n=1 Tax=Cytobacillus stercorigallinarum TaxID=2762240 RepID=A0ABR8QUS0_9BACI|nr:5-oxoprolinase subunit PxpB [Cytobacillus stercorigallinarum]MBD7939287.1 5-oxoprolinase subunit PxpB [Cytobacillus stercorigallinarum]